MKIIYGALHEEKEEERLIIERPAEKKTAAVEKRALAGLSPIRTAAGELWSSRWGRGSFSVTKAGVCSGTSKRRRPRARFFGVSLRSRKRSKGRGEDVKRTAALSGESFLGRENQRSWSRVSI